VYKIGARAVQFVHEVTSTMTFRTPCQLKILNPEVCRIQSAAVWHVLSFSSVSRLGAQPLQGSEVVLVCALCGSGVLRAALQMVTVGIRL
jgi:hypothetical protein